MSDEVTPADWAGLLSPDIPGVELRLSQGLMIYGGIEWTLPAAVTPEAAKAILQLAAAASETVASGEPGRGGIMGALQKLWPRSTDKLYRAVLAALEIAPPFSDPKPSYMGLRLTDTPTSGACAILQKAGLTFHYVHPRWITSHETAPVCTPYALIPRAILPTDAQSATRLVDFVALAATQMTHYPLRTCRFCGRSLTPLHMHDRTCCQSCAEQHLGILH